MLAHRIDFALSRTPLDALGRAFPFVSSLYRDHVWPRLPNGLWGVFDTEAEARRAIPARLGVGWDNAGVHGELRGQPSIYAVLFWLARTLRPDGAVIDLGGGLGTLYFALRDRGALPDGVRWQIVEVPAVIEAGRRHVAEQGGADVTFTTEISADARPDVVIASGVVQYMHHDCAGFFASLPPLAPHVLINKLALTPGPSFWTLQNIGGVAVPYRMYNVAEFEAGCAAAGYTIADRWTVAEIQLDVPFHRRRRLSHLSGLWLTRATSD